MTEREKLSAMIDEAEREIEKNRSLYTDGWLYEMERVIGVSKDALDGKGVPFVRSRAFFEPREEEECRHALKYYARYPSYDMQFYGIEPALKCFRKNRADKRIDELEAAAERYREIIKNADTSGGIGSYDKESTENVKRALERLDKSGSDDRLSMLIDVCNAMRRCTATRIIRSDLEPNSNIFLTEDERTKLLSSLESNPIMKKYYNKIKKYSSIYTLEDTEQIQAFIDNTIDYDLLNGKFYIWSKTDKTITFHTPENTAYAELNLILPHEENEQEGLGHIWIDNVRVSASSGDWNIQNGGFEESCELCPCKWTPIVRSGDPKIITEREYPFCGNERSSLYICNRSAQDEGGIKYSEFIKTEGDIDCTVVFDAKVDGKFKKGLLVEIKFFDADKNYISEYTHYFNRKSVPAGVPFGLTMQTDAILYYITNDITYAKKAKNQFMYVLNDFIQGQESWFAYDLRPDGSDAYGAVQGGRVLCALMGAYTFIKDAGVFSDKDWKTVKEQLKYMVSYLYDGRPRAELDSTQVRKDASNWQTDMSCGTGFLIMTMPKTEESAIWLDSINYFLKSQLLANISADGTWPESMRYHLAAAEHFAIYARVLKHCTGEDWFKDTPLTDMMYYPVAVQTPPYEFMDGKISTPTIGDHIMLPGTDLAILGLYYSDVYEADSEKGTDVYMTWKNAGKPMMKFSHEGVAMTALLGGLTDIEERELNLKSTDKYSGAGIYVMRDNKGSYCAISAPSRHIGHGHFDSGSLIIYKHNIPVVIDPGIESYFDPTKDWYVSSSAHSVVQFARNGGKKPAPDPFDICLEKTDYSALHGWNDTARTVEPLDFSAGDTADRFSVRIPDIEGRGAIVRTVTFIKDTGAWLIEDIAEKYTGQLRWSLVTAMKNLEIHGNIVSGKGYYDVDMEVIFLTTVEDISIEEGITTSQFPCEGAPKAQIIRAVSRNGFKALVYPHR